MDNDTKPTCQLSGTDGNAFAIIGNVSRCLKNAGLRDEAKDWVEAAFACGSYDALLSLAFRYVEVE